MTDPTTAFILTTTDFHAEFVCRDRTFTKMIANSTMITVPLQCSVKSSEIQIVEVVTMNSGSLRPRVKTFSSVLDEASSDGSGQVELPGLDLRKASFIMEHLKVPEIKPARMIGADHITFVSLGLSAAGILCVGSGLVFVSLALKRFKKTIGYQA
jgi:hypothetical protein